MKLLFFLSLFFIIYTMIGYPLLLKILDKTITKKDININPQFEPHVTIIIPVHNEEKVIENKIKNLLSLNYPQSKLDIIITSDNSTDKTNIIVEKFTETTPNITLLEVKERKGKTNAQDEAVDISTGEILIFSDANSILDAYAIKEIVSFMYDEKISYVAGKLEYINENKTNSTESENQYWNYDLEMRRIESSISSITAGNGALYGVRRTEYKKIDPIYSHDSVFPPKFVIEGKRAVFNSNAIAFEKSGESLHDEFKRKVRMFRKIIKINFLDKKKYNFLSVGIFSLFYFSHRTCRNFLFLFHLILLISNIWLLNNVFFLVIFLCQILFFINSLLGVYIQKKYFRVFTYYTMTILAQLVGAFREITGKSKPFWEIVESTR